MFHYAEYKEIPPLSSLAEIKTLKDLAGNGVATMGHLWWEYRQPGYIKCREYACLTCEKCERLQFGSCVLGTARVNTVRTCEVKFLHSNGIIPERETSNQVCALHALTSDALSLWLLSRRAKTEATE